MPRHPCVSADGCVQSQWPETESEIPGRTASEAWGTILSPDARRGLRSMYSSSKATVVLLILCALVGAFFLFKSFLWGPHRAATVAAFRNGVWLLDENRNDQWDGERGGDRQARIGQLGDIPVVGDWSGDGRITVGVFRRGSWLLDHNGNYKCDGAGVGQPWWTGSGQDQRIALGRAGDTPGHGAIGRLGRAFEFILGNARLFSFRIR